MNIKKTIRVVDVRYITEEGETWVPTRVVVGDDNTIDKIKWANRDDIERAIGKEVQWVRWPDREEVEREYRQMERTITKQRKKYGRTN